MAQLHLFCMCIYIYAIFVPKASAQKVSFTKRIFENVSRDLADACAGVKSLLCTPQSQTKT